MILAQDSLLNRPFKRSEPVSKKQWCGVELGNLETERKPRSFVQHCKTPFCKTCLSPFKGRALFILCNCWHWCENLTFWRPQVWWTGCSWCIDLSLLRDSRWCAKLYALRQVLLFVSFIIIILRWHWQWPTVSEAGQGKKRTLQGTRQSADVFLCMPEHFLLRFPVVGKWPSWDWHLFCLSLRL